MIFGCNYEHPRYTIAIPTFNRGPFLIDAIESAIYQSYDGIYEVMVVDNNPDRNDSTEQSMARYANNPCISYYKNSTNIAMFGNWNRLYELAKGEYVIMLHDDDMLFDSYLKIMDLFIEKTNGRYQQIYSLHYSCSERRDKFSFSIPESFTFKYKEKKAVDFSSGCVLGIPSGMLLWRDAFKAIGPFDSVFFPCSDIEFATRSTKRVECCQIRLPLVMYYIGVNESMNPITAQKVPFQYEKIQDAIYMDYPLLWKFVLKLTRRANLISMCKHMCTFTDYSNMEIGLKEIGYKPNILLEKCSFLCQFAIKLYLLIARTKSIRIINQ
jgi:glycosyltransferase involved in cell wall biosynthesis